MDLLVNLYDMGAGTAVDAAVRRALSPDKAKVLDFVRLLCASRLHSDRKGKANPFANKRK